MGRNGKKQPVFPAMIRFVNENVGKVVSSGDILLGKEPDRGAETSYLYKFIKLGYVQPLEGHTVNNKYSQFKIVKSFPASYNSVDLGRELKIANGLIPE